MMAYSFIIVLNCGYWNGSAVHRPHQGTKSFLHILTDFARGLSSPLLPSLPSFSQKIRKEQEGDYQPEYPLHKSDLGLAQELS